MMKSPLQVKRVRGTPIRVYGRTLEPIARVVSAIQHRAVIRQGRYEGSGWGAVWVHPLAVVEHDGGSAHTTLIPDPTAAALRQMAVVAVVVPVLCLAVISLARRARDR